MLGAVVILMIVEQIIHALVVQLSKLQEQKDVLAKSTFSATSLDQECEHILIVIKIEDVFRVTTQLSEATLSL